MKQHFQVLADYNSWANRRLYAATFALEDAAWRPLGLFFGSIHATLNHLLVADRIWLGRLTGKDQDDGPLDKIAYQEMGALAAARQVEDERLQQFVADLDEQDFDRLHRYQNTSGATFEQPLTQILTHIFNHQTHHRGQAHTGLTLLGVEAPSLDLVVYYRGIAAPEWASFSLD